MASELARRINSMEEASASGAQGGLLQGRPKPRRVVVFDRIRFGLSSRPAVWGGKGQGEPLRGEVARARDAGAGAAAGAPKAAPGGARRRGQDGAAAGSPDPRHGGQAGRGGERGHPNTGKDVVSKLMEHLLTQNMKTQEEGEGPPLQRPGHQARGRGGWRGGAGPGGGRPSGGREWRGGGSGPGLLGQ